ncbi:MAG TPA: type III-A CRISPR-associated RAMP protein Csm3 [Candidatus Desulfofervidus auxilii]|uniref:CRISPR system Cms endoribonuclease Csm3 n=2 Tax=Thermodesulfobacteriota TaxID=200940 RepID=A0A7C0Y4P7_DESA2|nr:CRISPR-Cas system type III CSM-effector complex subunit Csm3 [Candidatus Thermodesulfobacterium syntrophicum]RLG10101.1 MAG: type III-A CRISPR-associated RAMP protein Csm3 [Candidatus Pacearchaeota archaeon]HDD43808.1 type III-A CRISPR-associated RAMP protein Csm3 [Candidatus Desulfofervidus auxilii]
MTKELTKFQLKKIFEIKGKIRLLTGLHIGSGDTEMHIGGVDNLVIKHPHTNEPYIPGSSLKGKIRSLLELYYGLPVYAYEIDKRSGGLTHPNLLQHDKEEVKENAKKILKIFGLSGSAKEDVIENIGPTRVAFADCFYNKEYRNKLREENLPYTEIKAENRINRITGTAKDPRFIERVPAGAEFDFQITFKVINKDDEDLFDELLKGIKLLELDYLGGSGSRGYGRIKFEIEDEEIKKKYESIKLF